MKKTIFLFSLSLLFAFTTAPAHTQTLKKAAQNMLKKMEERTAQKTHSVTAQLTKATRLAQADSQAEALRAAAKRTALEAVRENPFSEGKIPGSERIRSVRSLPGGITEITISNARFWLPQTNDSRRAVDLLCQYKNWTRREALDWIYKNPREASRRLGIPQFTDKAYLMKDFTAAVPPQNVWTYYPSYRLPQDMLRGMELRQTASDMREILERGLSADRAGVDKWTNKKLIFTTSSAQIALKYIWQDNRSVPVIVHLQNTPPVIHPAEKTVKDIRPEDLPQIFETEQDIPAENILRISAFLCIDGVCRWGAVTQTHSGLFLFRPYKIDRSEYVKKGTYLFLNRLFDND